MISLTNFVAIIGYILHCVGWIFCSIYDESTGWKVVDAIMAVLTGGSVVLKFLSPCSSVDTAIFIFAVGIWIFVFSMLKASGKLRV